MSEETRLQAVVEIVRTLYLCIPQAATIYRTTDKKYAVVRGADTSYTGCTFDGYLYLSPVFARDAALLWCAKQTTEILASKEGEGGEIN